MPTRRIIIESTTADYRTTFIAQNMMSNKEAGTKNWSSYPHHQHHHRRCHDGSRFYYHYRGQQQRMEKKKMFIMSTMKRMPFILIMLCAIYGISFITYILIRSNHGFLLPTPHDTAPHPLPQGEQALHSTNTRRNTTIDGASMLKALALQENPKGSTNMLKMVKEEESDSRSVTSSREAEPNNKKNVSTPEDDTSHLAVINTNTSNLPNSASPDPPRHAVMIIAVFPNSIHRISAIWSQLECLANDYDKIILVCDEGYTERVKAALATLHAEVARNMPEIAEKLEIQFYQNDGMYDAGLWCNALTKDGILEKGPNGIYVGGTSNNNFQDFLLINDSSMAVEKTTNELMENIHQKNLSMASLNFWDAEDNVSQWPYLEEPVSTPFWVESYARAFSLEGIQIFADKLCSRERPIAWRKDCPDMLEWKNLSGTERRKKCIVRLTEVDVATFYPRDQVHGIYPGKVPEHMLKKRKAFALKKSWTGHYAFWSDVLRDKMKFPMVKVSEQEFLTHAKNKRPEDFATCTKNMDESILVAPFEERDLWFGEAIEVDKGNDGGKSAVIHTLEVVVAYCQTDLHWMKNYIFGRRKLKKLGITNVKMTIMSRCGNEKNVPNFVDKDLASEVNVVSLPNVGGCDYAYAHFINEYVSSHTMEDAKSSVILFIKDLPRTIEDFDFFGHSKYRDIEEMLRIAASGKFICGVKTKCDTSAYHDTSVLSRFSLFPGIYVFPAEGEKGKAIQEAVKEEDFNIHGYENLRDFHDRALKWTFPPKKMTPVCYGGTFAMPASRLISLSNQIETKGVMKNLEDALSRKSKISATIEAHFAERTWAGLFSIPLTVDQIRVNHAKTWKGNRIFRYKASIFGAFRSEESQCYSS